MIQLARDYSIATPYTSLLVVPESAGANSGSRRASGRRRRSAVFVDAVHGRWFRRRGGSMGMGGMGGMGGGMAGMGGMGGGMGGMGGSMGGMAGIGGGMGGGMGGGGVVGPRRGHGRARISANATGVK